MANPNALAISCFTEGKFRGDQTGILSSKADRMIILRKEGDWLTYRTELSL